MNIPSIKTILDGLEVNTWADDPTKRCQEIRAVLERARDKAGNGQLGLRSVDYFLKELDKLVETHGVETIDAWKDGERVPAAFYLNSGDPYKPTILFDVRAGTFRITTWGDWVESQERRGRKFP